MEKHILSKSTFIRGSQCLKSLYLNKKRPFLRNRLSDAQRAIFKRGTDVGLLAQQLFPEGVNMKPRSPSQYRKKVLETAEIIKTNSSSVIYEAAFQYNQLLILLDILVKSHNEWTAYEVKSSLKISETFLMDAAFQYYVMTGSGVSLEDFYLVYMNKDYKLDGETEIESLFIRQSVLEEVKARQPFIKEQIEKEKIALTATSSPLIPIGTQCYNPYPCDFTGHCWKKVMENSFLYLDAFEETERFAKYYAGKDDPKDMSSEGLSPLQKAQLVSAKEKALYLDRDKIQSFVHRYLDAPAMLSVFFVKPAVPYINKTKPYQLVPVAALTGKKGETSGSVEFFIQEGNPKEIFEAYLRKLFANNSKIIIYDKSEIINYLKESEKTALLEEAENKLTDYMSLYKEAVLFHYLIRSDYSPENISRILLGIEDHRLNPALTGMNWQRKFFERSDDFSELKRETKEYLKRSIEFNFAFANYLKTLR